MTTAADARFRLSRWVNVRVRGEDLVFVHDDTVAVRRVGGVGPALAQLLTRPEGFSREAFVRLLGPERGPRLLERLVGLRVVRVCGGGGSDLPDQLDQQVGFFESLTEHPEESQRRVCDARVAVVGVGGIGGVVLQHLLGAGVRKLLLVDGDTVEPSNLNRQFLYRPDDVGRPKVDVVSEYLEAYDEDVDLTVLPEYVRGHGQLEKLAWAPGFVVGAADHPPGAIHDWLGAYAWASGAGYLSCGVGVHRGYWGPLVRPGVTPCPECTAASMALLPARGELDGADAFRVTVSFGPVNTVVGAAVSADVILDLAGLLPREHARSLNVVDLYRRRFARVPGPHRRAGCRVDGCVEAQAE